MRPCKVCHEISYPLLDYTPHKATILRYSRPIKGVFDLWNRTPKSFSMALHENPIVFYLLGTIT